MLRIDVPAVYVPLKAFPALCERLRASVEPYPVALVPEDRPRIAHFQFWTNAGLLEVSLVTLTLRPGEGFVVWADSFAHGQQVAEALNRISLL